MQPTSAQGRQMELQRLDRAHGPPRAQRLHGRTASLQSACWILVLSSSQAPTPNLRAHVRREPLVGLWPQPTWEPVLHPGEALLSSRFLASAYRGSVPSGILSVQPLSD